MDAGRSTGERRSLPFRRQVGQSLHQRACAPIFSSFQHFLFLDFSSNISIKVVRCYIHNIWHFWMKLSCSQLVDFELTRPSWVNTQTPLLSVNADVRHFLSWIWSLVVQLEHTGNSWCFFSPHIRISSPFGQDLFLRQRCHITRL